MRLTFQVVSSLALATASLANHAFLYTFDITESNRISEPTIVSSERGFSILARRRQSTEQQVLGNISEEELRLLNSYGGIQQSVFGGSDQAPKTRIFLQIRGHDHGMILAATL